MRLVFLLDVVCFVCLRQFVSALVLLAVCLLSVCFDFDVVILFWLLFYCF